MGVVARMAASGVSAAAAGGVMLFAPYGEEPRRLSPACVHIETDGSYDAILPDLREAAGALALHEVDVSVMLGNGTLDLGPKSSVSRAVQSVGDKMTGDDCPHNQSRVILFLSSNPNLSRLAIQGEVTEELPEQAGAYLEWSLREGLRDSEQADQADAADVLDRVRRRLIFERLSWTKYAAAFICLNGIGLMGASMAGWGINRLRDTYYSILKELEEGAPGTES